LKLKEMIEANRIIHERKLLEELNRKKRQNKKIAIDYDDLSIF
jgi:hypothetical protein